MVSGLSALQHHPLAAAAEPIDLEHRNVFILAL
jgi:hypothetical protein